MWYGVTNNTLEMLANVTMEGLQPAFGSTTLIGLALVGLVIGIIVFTKMDKAATVFVLMGITGLLSLMGYIPEFVYVIALIGGAIGLAYAVGLLGGNK